MKNTTLNIILGVLASLVMIILLAQTVEGVELTQNTFSESYIHSEKSVIIEKDLSSRHLSTTTDPKKLKALIQECNQLIDSANRMIQSGRELGYKDNHPVILLAKDEINQLTTNLQEYKARLERIRWNQRITEYPAASLVWLELKDYGYSDMVCAGIIGNMMAECGGQTLNLVITENSHSGFYGLCQWSLKYYSEAKDMSLEAQCCLLNDTLEGQMNDYGYLYKDDFNYKSFINLTSIKEIAISFATCYERCGSGSYDVRAANAQIAYDYFTS